ncbi:jacalin-like lectin [Allorhizocola rhizosphaerae]|uniref:jacalin-like lectin n=1 Tax=Allorhizocola rhizosphaerae TaxID=1872709 RepID=UPI001FE7C8E3|nr:jacalin-like lectin [Allorhizocola rhizosphaerae]
MKLLGLALLAALLPAAPASAATSGTFSVLTYNIAGLPEGWSSGNPSKNTTPIGHRLPAYDIVHVQEDFNYHADLYAADTHPHRTPTSGGAGFGDGLNTLSDFPYSDFTRVRWSNCNGTDCLTPKGFTWSRIRLAEGVHVDFYNVHANAGTSTADLAARRANISQLSRYIATNSAGNAVIVMGDTNTRYTRVEDNIRDLVSANRLTDAWVRQERGGVPPAAGSPALVCDEENVTNSCEVVDKILYRGNRFIDLRLMRYHNENAAFVDGEGEPLSDHYPIAAWFSWSLHPGLLMSDSWGGPHGAPFTDVDRVAIGSRVTSVSLRSGSRVDQVSLAQADGAVMTHGGTGGTAASLTLGTNEYVTQVAIGSGQKDGHTRVFYLRFTTNLGRTLAGGTATANMVTYTAPPGWRLAGFHGRAGSEMDKLGLIYTPIALVV